MRYWLLYVVCWLRGGHVYDTPEVTRHGGVWRDCTHCNYVEYTPPTRD